MPRAKIAVGEYYHIYNRGNNKQEIFADEKDYIRFLFLTLYLQGNNSIYNISRYVSFFVRHRMFNINIKAEGILSDRYVELVSFVFMPNHFHMIVKETKEGGISKYLQRIQNAYTKYINTKNSKIGHLFQGAFQSVHINSNEQLLHLSAYVHRNPRELRKWKNKEHLFQWSSYDDFVKENRWGGLLKPEIILRQFSSSKEYQNFVNTSGTKLTLDEEHLI